MESELGLPELVVLYQLWHGFVGNVLDFCSVMCNFREVEGLKGTQELCVSLRTVCT